MFDGRDFVNSTRDIFNFIEFLYMTIHLVQLSKKTKTYAVEDILAKKMDVFFLNYIHWDCHLEIFKIIFKTQEGTYKFVWKTCIILTTYFCNVDDENDGKKSYVTLEIISLILNILKCLNSKCAQLFVVRNRFRLQSNK